MNINNIFLCFISILISVSKNKHPLQFYKMKMVNLQTELIIYKEQKSNNNT